MRRPAAGEVQQPLDESLIAWTVPPPRGRPRVRHGDVRTERSRAAASSGVKSRCASAASS